MVSFSITLNDHFRVRTVHLKGEYLKTLIAYCPTVDNSLT